MASTWVRDVGYIYPRMRLLKWEGKVVGTTVQNPTTKKWEKHWWGPKDIVKTSSADPSKKHFELIR